MSETTLMLKIEENSSSAIHALNALTFTLERLQRIVDNVNGLNKVAKGVEKINTAVTNAVPEESVQRLERVADALERLNSIGAIKIKLSSGAQKVMQTQPLENLNSAVDKAKDDMQVTADSTRQMSDAFESTAPAAQSAAHGIREYFRSIMEYYRANRSIDNHRSAWERLKPVLQQVGKAYLAPLRAGMKAISGIISNVTSKIGGLISKIKRIALYRLIRSLIKMLTDGVKTGLENLYNYSKAINGNFAKAMDVGASAALKLKNSIGAMLGPVLEAVIPVFVQITEAAIQATNAINQFFSALTGQTTWTHAIDVMTEYDAATKKSIGSTKQLKNLLADWDELNIIQSNSGNGGSGSGSSGLDYSKMFVTEELPNNRWTRIANEINEAIESGDWEGLGNKAGNKIASYFNSIFNVEPDTIEETAHNFAGAVNGVLAFANSFINYSDFAAMGRTVGTFVTELFSKNGGIKWSGIGQIFKNSLTGIVETASGFLSNPNALGGNVGGAVADMYNSAFIFTEDEKERLSNSVSSVVEGAVLTGTSAVTEFFSSAEFEKQIDSIFDIIVKVITKIDWIKLIKELGNTIGVVVAETLSVIWHVVSKIALGVYDVALVPAWTAIQGFWNNTIIPGLNNIKKWIEDNVINPIAEMIASIVGTIETAFNGLIDFVTGIINTVIGLVNQAIDAINSISITIPGLTLPLVGEVWKEFTIGFNVEKIPLIGEELNKAGEEAAQNYISGFLGDFIDERLSGDFNDQLDKTIKSYQDTIDRANQYAEKPLPDISWITENKMPEITEEKAKTIDELFDDLFSALEGYDADIYPDDLEYFDNKVIPIIESLLNLSGKYVPDELEETTEAVRGLFTLFNSEPESMELGEFEKNVQDSFTSISNAVGKTVTDVQTDVRTLTATINSLNGLGFKWNGSIWGGMFVVTKGEGDGSNGSMYTTNSLTGDIGSGIMSRLSGRTEVKNTDQAQAEQNNLIRESNNLLRRIAAKDTTVKINPSAAFGKLARISADMYARTTGLEG